MVLHSEQVVFLLFEICLHLDIDCTESSYDQMPVLVINDGLSFLAFLETPTAIRKFRKEHLSRIKPPLRKGYFDLLETFQSLATSWRGSLDTDHSLRMYLDA